jgi:hypothetical protein
MRLTRRALLAAALAGAGTLVARPAAAARPTITVYKDPG